jgi:uncharacterized membrane protein
MRLANSIESVPSAEHPDRVGDALASACLFGIVGGLVFALAVVPTIGAVLVGAAIGAIGGIFIAYH